MERVTGGRKAHFGLRSSIAGRWMFNTLSATMTNAVPNSSGLKIA